MPLLSTKVKALPRDSLFVWVRASPDQQFGAREPLFMFSKRGDEFASGAVNAAGIKYV
jgi:hypothetical protein